MFSLFSFFLMFHILSVFSPKISSKCVTAGTSEITSKCTRQILEDIAEYILSNFEVVKGYF